MANPLIIDVHMHIYPTKEQGLHNVGLYDGWEFGDPDNIPLYTHYGGDVEDAVAALAEAGASKGIFVNFYGPLMFRHDRIEKIHKGMSEAQRNQAIRDIDSSLAEELKDYNVWACEAVKDYPQLIPFVCIDPWVLGVPEAEEHLRDMVENHGARGIKLHSVIQRYYMDDPRMWAIYRTCVELDLAIIAHSGSAAGEHQYGDPKAFAPTYDRFPTLKLVMAHMGNGSWHQTREVAEAYPNVMFDICEIMEWDGAPNAPTHRQLAQLIKDVGSERVMLGSDFPWWDTATCVQKLMDFPLLSGEEKEGILGSNAARLLGI